MRLVRSVGGKGGDRSEWPSKGRSSSCDRVDGVADLARGRLSCIREVVDRREASPYDDPGVEVGEDLAVWQCEITSLE